MTRISATCFLFLICFFYFYHHVAASSIECPPKTSERVKQATLFQNRVCYFIVENATENAMIKTTKLNEYGFDVDDARNVCGDHGGTLPMIRTSDENQFILQRFADDDFWPEAPENISCIALGMQVSAGIWTWDDGSRITNYPHKWRPYVSADPQQFTCTKYEKYEIQWITVSRQPTDKIIGVLCETRRISGAKNRPALKAAANVYPKTKMVPGNNPIQEEAPINKHKRAVLTNCHASKKAQFEFTFMYGDRFCYFAVKGSQRAGKKGKFFDIAAARNVCAKHNGLLPFADTEAEFRFVWDQIVQRYPQTKKIPMSITKDSTNVYKYDNGNPIHMFPERWAMQEFKKYKFTFFLFSDWNDLHFVDEIGKVAPMNFVCKDAVPMRKSNSTVPVPRSNETMCGSSDPNVMSYVYNGTWCYSAHMNSAQMFNKKTASGKYVFDIDAARNMCKMDGATMPSFRGAAERTFLVRQFLSDEFEGIALGTKFNRFHDLLWDDGTAVDMVSFPFQIMPGMERTQLYYLLTGAILPSSGDTSKPLLLVCKRSMDRVSTKRPVLPGVTADAHHTDEQVPPEPTRVRTNKTKCDIPERAVISRIYKDEWCYYAYNESATFVNGLTPYGRYTFNITFARFVCKTNAATLPIIENSKENAFLTKTFLSNDGGKGFDGLVLGMRALYNGQLMWDDGQLLKELQFDFDYGDSEDLPNVQLHYLNSNGYFVPYDVSSSKPLLLVCKQPLYTTDIPTPPAETTTQAIEETTTSQATTSLLETTSNCDPSFSGVHEYTAIDYDGKCYFSVRNSLELATTYKDGNPVFDIAEARRTCDKYGATVAQATDDSEFLFIWETMQNFSKSSDQIPLGMKKVHNGYKLDGSDQVLRPKAVKQALNTNDYVFSTFSIDRGQPVFNDQATLFPMQFMCKEIGGTQLVRRPNECDDEKPLFKTAVRDAYWCYFEFPGATRLLNEIKDGVHVTNYAQARRYCRSKNAIVPMPMTQRDFVWLYTAFLTGTEEYAGVLLDNPTSVQDTKNDSLLYDSESDTETQLDVGSVNSSVRNYMYLNMQNKMTKGNQDGVLKIVCQQPMFNVSKLDVTTTSTRPKITVSKQKVVTGATTQNKQSVTPAVPEADTSPVQPRSGQKDKISSGSGTEKMSSKTMQSLGFCVMIMILSRLMKLG